MKLKNLFNSNLRISRKNFLLLILIGYLTLIFLFILLGYIIKYKVAILVYITFFIFTSYLLLFIVILNIAVIQRLHDLGLDSSSLYQSFFIPIKGDLLCIRLFFEKGQMQDNEYGQTTWNKEDIEKQQPSELKRKIINMAIENSKKRKKGVLWKCRNKKNLKK